MEKGLAVQLIFNNFNWLYKTNSAGHPSHNSNQMHPTCGWVYLLWQQFSLQCKQECHLLTQHNSCFYCPLLKTVKGTGTDTHTHVYIPVLKKQLRAVVSVSIVGKGWGRNLFSVWSTMSFTNWLLLPPSFLIWPTAITSIQFISHTSPVKTHCQVPWLQDYIFCRFVFMTSDGILFFRYYTGSDLVLSNVF